MTLSTSVGVHMEVIVRATLPPPPFRVWQATALTHHVKLMARVQSFAGRQTGVLQHLSELTTIQSAARFQVSYPQRHCSLTVDWWISAQWLKIAEQWLAILARIRKVSDLNLCLKIGYATNDGTLTDSSLTRYTKDSIQRRVKDGRTVCLHTIFTCWSFEMTVI
jgi:hypothetical protein